MTPIGSKKSRLSIGILESSQAAFLTQTAPKHLRIYKRLSLCAPIFFGRLFVLDAKKSGYPARKDAEVTAACKLPLGRFRYGVSFGRVGIVWLQSPARGRLRHTYWPALFSVAPSEGAG